MPAVFPFIGNAGMAVRAAATRRILIPILLTVLFAAAPAPANAYAVLTHEELIDLLWDDSIRPLLLARFPGADAAALERAHAYAYGGCVIQDLGYYPFSKHLFSDLTHYVRTGDFVAYLLANARNPDELAFAIGALSHYIGDSIGHPQAVNPSTAITFPDLEKRYGTIVTYEEAPRAHIRTEFGFDVAQLGRRRFAPRRYHRHIGFRVSRALLDRAFAETYGLTVRGMLGPERSAIGGYRASVRSLLPLFAEATLVNLRGKLPPSAQSAAEKQVVEDESHATYRTAWSGAYRPPGIGAHLLAYLIRIVPKIGILSVLAIESPDAATEELYLESMNTTVDRFRQTLAHLRDGAADRLPLANLDLDTGRPVEAGKYALTDKTYAKLLERVTRPGARPAPEELRENILEYYRDPAAPIVTKKDPEAWRKVRAELAVLEQMPVSRERRRR